MQILTSTWDAILIRHRIPPGGADPPSRYNPHDAIYAAAYYLCDNGARRGDVPAAVLVYNHSTRYLTTVLAQAARYTQTDPTLSLPCGSARADGEHAGLGPALVAVGFACAQLGKPYVWGGNGNPGFDCSGLTHAAYAAAGIDRPRTAQAQYDAGPLLPAGTPLQPGDLVFFGTPNGSTTSRSPWAGR